MNKMNKLRLIKIYELRGKIHPMEAFIIDILDGIKEYKDGNFINYKKEDELYFYQDLKIDDFWLSYRLVWSFFETKFKCNYYETQEVTKYLLEKHLNKRVTTTSGVLYKSNTVLEKHLNKRVTTTKCV